METQLTIITIITVIYGIFITYLMLKNLKYRFEFNKTTTDFKHTLVGYYISLWHYSGYSSSCVWGFYIPIKNRHKIELKEEIERLIKDETNQRYNLNAKFSWLKTWKEVEQFQKDYSCVDKELVDKLVSEFKIKKHV